MTSEPFEEFRAIAVVINDARGEAKGLLASVDALAKHLAELTALMTRALSQAEAVATRAAKIADDAAAALAARSASQDAVHAELARLREQAKAALR